jgi:hypothetical protein
MYNTIDYYISIAIRIEFGFIGIAKLRAKVINRVEYKDTFFLIKGVLKILLN